MSLTQIIDTIVPTHFTQYQKEYTPEKFDFLSSAAVGAVPAEVAAQMTAGGTLIDMPFWQDTDRTEPDILTDDDAIRIVPKKITASQEKARKIFIGKAWSQADLAGVFATGNPKDPIAQISDFIANYWRAMAQKSIVKCLDGILADNVANDASDMLYSVYSDIATPLAANKMSPAAITSARLTMGEMMDDVGVIVVHSKVYGDMLNQDDIDFVQNSKLPFKIPMYAGMQIVVSNSVTVSTTHVNSPKYRNYILGPNAISYMEHFPEMSTEPWRDPLAGRGGGTTTLITRRHRLLHPRGFKWTETSVADKSPNFAELATAANWDRKYQRGNIKICYLETN